MKIIDSHIHVGLHSFFLPQESSPPYELCNNYEDAIALMDKHEVEQAVIVPISHRAFDAKRSNEYIYEASRRFPNRLIPFAELMTTWKRISL